MKCVMISPLLSFCISFFVVVQFIESLTFLVDWHSYCSDIILLIIFFPSNSIGGLLEKHLWVCQGSRSESLLKLTPSQGRHQ